MISNRNIESKADYILLRSYMGASDDEIEGTKSRSVEDAVDNTVKNTPGGEFLKNVKMYIVKRDNKRFYAVEGDVWGFESKVGFRGFKVGDKVQWKTLFSKKAGIITDLKDSKKCTIQVENSNDVVIIKYDDLLKLK